MEGERAAAIVTATTFHASIMAAVSTPDRKKRLRDSGDGKSIQDCCVSLETPEVEYDLKFQVNRMDEKDVEEVEVEEIKEEENMKKRDGIIGIGVGIEAVTAATLVTATTSATSYLLASTSPAPQKKKTISQKVKVEEKKYEGKEDAVGKIIGDAEELEEMRKDVEEVNKTPKREEENKSEEEEMMMNLEEHMPELSRSSAERAVATNVVLSTTSATSIMLAAVNNMSRYNESDSTYVDSGICGCNSQVSCNSICSAGDSDDGHSHVSHPESISSAGSILPPLLSDQLWNDDNNNNNDNPYMYNNKEELPESSRQSETTHNKFLAVDVISHKSAWLFHLIDRNSDASLTLSEFIMALADQPLVSMALDLPQKMTVEGSLKKVEQRFKAMDYNNSGTINIQKFLHYIDKVRRKESIQLLHDTKKKLDALIANSTEVALAASSRPSSAVSEANDKMFQMDYSLAVAGNRRLNLSSRNIRDSDMSVITENLSTNSVLRFLVLSRNNIGIDGIILLSKALRDNATLTRLDVGSNQFGNEGIIRIAETLHTNSTLKRLDLSNNPMGVSGARAIANSLMVNKSVQELSLRGNYMGNEGAMLIGESLRYNTVLTSLFLQDNNIDPLPGMRGIVTSLYSIDNFVLERLEGVDIAAFSRILDINPEPCSGGSGELDNTKILAIMRKRRGLHVSKRIMNK